MFSAWEDSFMKRPKVVIVRETADFYNEKRFKQVQKKHIATKTICEVCESMHDDALDNAEITADALTPLYTPPIVQSQETQREYGETPRPGKNFGNAKIY